MPDCICVAANVLLLCVLGRDPKQLKPVLSAHIETDECGNLHNRFAEDRGKVDMEKGLCEGSKHLAAQVRGMKFAPEKSELIHFNKGRRQWSNQLELTSPGRGTSPVRPKESARFLGVWLDRKLNWKAHLAAVERKLRTQSYALSRLAASTWGLGLAKAREVYTKCIRSALAYGASSFHIPTDVGGEPVKKGTTKALGKAQNKSLRIVAGAFKHTPIRNLETETWVPPLDLYLNKRLADFETRLQRTDLDDGQDGKKTAGSVILTTVARYSRDYARGAATGAGREP
ncbi:hypothetical protein CHGG_06068 [Chaetomium globosum CBS 148.51]|uniref:Reverse transcriptase domain-containing protein n=1 Tax=Chaetomium globosum (strain ATCC 6205 / CBS 148.51 / DSM 1962 / NBRC 6347 / NRRL 1970) TaxID=306901 RepID=Q2H5J7_CHAGB|nr:uncharacterized protein CHGG_06068 [Chaetomium globosum CBS 148.51]EAQ89449.1 hypothetical protein CHGG_06068 [Chaetomium globosum CBS 148.51]